MRSPSVTENNSAQTRSVTIRPQTAGSDSRADRLTSAPGAVWVLVKCGSAVFSNSKASSFHSSVPHRRHLSKSLSDQKLIGCNSGSLRPVDIWRHRSVVRIQVAVSAAWLDAATWWWKWKCLGKTISQGCDIIAVYLTSFNCNTFFFFYF